MTEYELLAYAFGHAAVVWVTGFAAGLAAGFVRRLRDAA